MAHKIGDRGRTPRQTVCPAAQGVPHPIPADRAETAQLGSGKRHSFFHRCGRNRPGAATLAFALVVLLGATGCNGDGNAGAEANPSPSTTSPSPASPTPTASPTATGWESAYSDEQLANYEEALRRWEGYERESEPIWADPQPSPATLSFFGTYFYNEDLMQGRLRQYADADVKIDGLPTVLWSKALSIKGPSVRIRQCIDPGDVRVTQHGQPVPTSAGAILREIDLGVPEGSQEYLVKQIHDPSWGRKEQQCAGS